MNTWHQIEDLQQEVDFVVFGRLGIERKESEVDIEAYVERPLLDISATKIRSNVASGRPVKDMVDKDIVDELSDYYDPEFVFNDDVTVDIFDRFGNRVFHSNGYSSDKFWDGTNQKGKKLPMDAYYYVIDLHNGEVPFVGNVTLVR